MHFEIIKLETTPVARKVGCPKASFLAIECFVKLLHKIPGFFHDYSGFFKFNDFSMQGTFFSIFFRFSMICENPVFTMTRV